MIRRLLSLLAAGIAGTSGCLVGPDYAPPETPVPGGWLNAGASQESQVLAQWWHTFHDPELDSLVDRALRSNHDLAAATSRILQARAGRDIAVAGLWPTADVGATYQRTRTSVNGLFPLPPGFPPNTNLYQVGFDAAWELDAFGGKRRAVEAAGAQVGVAESDRRGVVVSLLGEVARLYLEARGFQRRLTIARNNIHAQEDVVALTRSLFKAGLTSELDVAQASTLLYATESQVPTLETGFQADAYALAVLCGAPPGALQAELTAQAPIPSTPPEVPVGLPSELLLRRPDIQRSERELAAATAQIGVATADLYPKFFLTGSLGLQSTSTSNWFTGPSSFWSVGPTATWRLFDAGKIRANIRLQTARQEEALEVYEQTVLSAMRDVESALVAYAKEQIRRESLDRAVVSSRQALDISQQLYQHGLVDFLRVLDSQRSVYVSEEALALSDVAVAVNLVTLFKALGGGWEGLDPVPEK
jgi:NodT family efflux transporter outer membrane factor (OMF) lipoprotein